MAPAPNLTFFCELDEHALVDLFADGQVIRHLQALNARISLGILDLTAGRAEVVKKLNAANIPVVAWLLLPTEDGYWFNVNNTAEASARYDAVKAWAAQHGLRWAGIGLDIEPDRREIEALMQSGIAMLPRLVAQALNSSRVRGATVAYGQLVRRIRTDGYQVESYHIPFIVDEREVGSSLLQRLAGLVDIDADREVLMLYTSFLGEHGTGFLWEYGMEAESIGVGSTGGGVDISDLQERALSWGALAHDLRLAAKLTDDIHIFSLEGCVQRGYLEKLPDFDWSGDIHPPREAAEAAGRIRRILRTVLWTSKNIQWIMLVAGLVFIMARLLFEGEDD